MGEKLYRFAADFGRMGYLRGTFTAAEAAVQAAMGKRAYFGEVLGKHSEIVLILDSKHIRALTDDAGFIAKFNEYGCASGFNPLNYITCPECNEPLDMPYATCGCGWKAADVAA